jgi:hypothetical protein
MMYLHETELSCQSIPLPVLLENNELLLTFPLL